MVKKKKQNRTVKKKEQGRNTVYIDIVVKDVWRKGGKLIVIEFHE